MSSETCRNAPPDASRIASSTIVSMPRRSTSYIVYTCTPSPRRRAFSPSSTLRTPIRTVRASVSIGMGHASLRNRGSGLRPSAIASGMPCTFPVGEVSGVFISVWASNQITPPGPP